MWHPLRSTGRTNIRRCYNGRVCYRTTHYCYNNSLNHKSSGRVKNRASRRLQSGKDSPKFPTFSAAKHSAMRVSLPEREYSGKIMPHYQWYRRHCVSAPGCPSSAHVSRGPHLQSPRTQQSSGQFAHVSPNSHTSSPHSTDAEGSQSPTRSGVRKDHELHREATHLASM
jgi:hypothetical protein